MLSERHRNLLPLHKRNGRPLRWFGPEFPDADYVGKRTVIPVVMLPPCPVSRYPRLDGVKMLRSVAGPSRQGYRTLGARPLYYSAHLQTETLARLRVANAHLSHTSFDTWSGANSRGVRRACRGNHHPDGTDQAIEMLGPRAEIVAVSVAAARSHSDRRRRAVHSA